MMLAGRDLRSGGESVLRDEPIDDMLQFIVQVGRHREGWFGAHLFNSNAVHEER